MLKVFIVEDEMIIREGIKRNIPWEKEGFIFAGDASDGELAYPKICDSKPDILVTDIRMPFMDGLELSRLVKKELPDTKIIILSGHNEFDYAKEAITIGVTDYLLKPISAAKLLESLHRVGQIVEEEKQQKQYLEAFEKEQKEKQHLEQQKLLRELFAAKQSAIEIFQKGREIGLDLSADCYNIILFQIALEQESKNKEKRTEGVSGPQSIYTEQCPNQFLNHCLDQIEEGLDDIANVFLVDMNMDNWAILIKGKNEAHVSRREDACVNLIRESVEGYTGMEYFIAVGEKVTRLSALGECYKGVSRVYAYRYFTGKNQLVRSADSLQPVRQEEKLDVRGISASGLDRRAVESFLKTGLADEVDHFIQDYFASIGENELQSRLFRQYVTMDMYFAAVSEAEQLGHTADEVAECCSGDFSMDVVFADTENAARYLAQAFRQVIAMRESASEQKYAVLLENARKYIREHFEEETISLNTVAANVGMSSNHFSTIFSQETGETFIEYLTDVRMEKARELLRGTSMRTTDIAYAVGYKDSHYFSYLFKKTQNCTPREYRMTSK